MSISNLNFCVVTLVFPFLCTVAASQAPPPDRANRYVVVMSLDGFAADSFRDPKVPLPTLRWLAANGASATSMQVANPAVTWPNHTTLVTGVTPATHSVLYNGLATRPGLQKPIRIEPWIDKAELVKAPTVYDLAHEAGLSTAEVDWVAIHNARSVNWSFAERPRVDGPIEKEMIAAGLVTEAGLREFAKAPITWRDEIWMQAAIHILQKHKPNLLLLHLLNTDSVQHRYGPGSLAGNTALALADRQVSRIIDALRSADMLERATVLIVSDHGFKTYQHLIRLNALLRKQNFVRGPDGQIDCDAWVVAEGGTAMVYITRNEKKSELIAELGRQFSGIEGVARVITPSEYEQSGYPSPKANEHMADLVVAAANGYSFDNATQGEVVVKIEPSSTPGSHGYLNTDAAMNGIFIAWGSGIKSGTDLGAINNTDVAPTIARLMQLKLNGASGHALVKALR